MIWSNSAVGVVKGILYGFKLLVYMFIVGVVSAIPIGFGARMMDWTRYEATYQNGIAAGLIGTGNLLFVAGTMGILYKVIADGVKAGMDASSMNNTIRQQTGPAPDNDS